MAYHFKYFRVLNLFWVLQCLLRQYTIISFSLSPPGYIHSLYTTFFQLIMLCKGQKKSKIYLNKKVKQRRQEKEIQLELFYIISIHFHLTMYVKCICKRGS